MQMPRPLFLAAGLVAGLALMPLAGCGRSETPSSGGHSHDHDHDHDHSHDHDGSSGHGQSHGHGHGPTTVLGEQTAGGLTIAASRGGDLKAGAEANFDVQVTGGEGQPSVVRLWVGAEDGRGALRALAHGDAHGWHAHAELPNPLPDDAKLWVEIETAQGQKVLTGFDLKR